MSLYHANVNIGDIFKRRNTGGTPYYNCTAKVTEISQNVIVLTLLIAGANNKLIWRNGQITRVFNPYLTLVDWERLTPVVALTQEEKVINKIKYLDTKWAKKQIKKGNPPCGALLATVS